MILAIISFATVANAQKERKFIRNGYSDYKDGKFVESEVANKRALELAPDSYEANYNLANSLFKQEKIDDALNCYSELAKDEKDKTKLSQLYHNIGDCHYAKKEYDKSVEAFKKSLKYNSSDDQTRYNLIAAQKMLNNQNNQDQNQDKNNQNQDQQKQDQKDKNEDQNKNQQDKDQQNKDNQDKQNQNQDQQQQPQNQQPKMSKEDAERLLNAIQQDENKLQENRKKEEAVGGARVTDKNW